MSHIHDDIFCKISATVNYVNPLIDIKGARAWHMLVVVFQILRRTMCCPVYSDPCGSILMQLSCLHGLKHAIGWIGNLE